MTAKRRFKKAGRRIPNGNEGAHPAQLDILLGLREDLLKTRSRLRIGRREAPVRFRHLPKRTGGRGGQDPIGLDGARAALVGRKGISGDVPKEREARNKVTRKGLGVR